MGMTTGVMADTLPNKKTLREKLSLWESSTAALSDVQLHSVGELNEHSSNRPLPIELPLDELPGINSLVLLDPAPPDDLIAQEMSALQLGKQKIDNAQQFFLWFSEVEDAIENEEDHTYTHYLSELENYGEQ